MKFNCSELRYHNPKQMESTEVYIGTAVGVWGKVLSLASYL